MHGECILRDTRYTFMMICFFICGKHKTDHITEDEINRVIARLKLQTGGQRM